ncbi:unnamed protein product [Trichogramma brassicae]|uniref:Reverse transcriptase domain-containing protein n=1 Tax=Trichogramma brassicae TaxID=86971 RepID=A0A6H5J362_9HYME|nr:unnamed protein product [Trichogramma brassicae]
MGLAEVNFVCLAGHRLSGSGLTWSVWHCAVSNDRRHVRPFRHLHNRVDSKKTLEIEKKAYYYSAGLGARTWILPHDSRLCWHLDHDDFVFLQTLLCACFALLYRCSARCRVDSRRIGSYGRRAAGATGALTRRMMTEDEEEEPRTPPPTADKAVCTSPIFSVGATSKRPAMSPPATRATPKRYAATATSRQQDENNNDAVDQDGFELVNRRRHRQRNQPVITVGFACLRKQPKPRPAQRRVHHWPDAIVIKANDASTYAEILRTLKSEPTLQQSVGNCVQNNRCSAAGTLVLQFRKNVENASTLGAELDKVLGDKATASALQHTTMIEIRDLDDCTTKDEIAEALSTSLSAPHINKEAVKTLRKAYAGTQTSKRLCWSKTMRRGQRGRMGQTIRDSHVPSQRSENKYSKLSDPSAPHSGLPFSLACLTSQLCHYHSRQEQIVPAVTLEETTKSMREDQGSHCAWPDGVPNSAIKIAIAMHPDIFLQVVHGVPENRCLSSVLEKAEACPVAKARQAPRRTIVVQAALYAGHSGQVLERIISISRRGSLTTIRMSDQSPYRVTAGVPQGSVLGPIVWNVMYDAVLCLNFGGIVKIVGYDLSSSIEQVRCTLQELGLVTADHKTRGPTHH